MSSSTTPASELQEQTAGDLYDSDVYAWSVKQADALRRRNFAAVDWDNVIEEIESVGRSEEHKWTSHCARTIEHLLSIEHYQQATKKTLHGWAREVRHFRGKMSDAIIETPSLKNKYQTMFANAWRTGRREALERLAEYDQQHNTSLDEDSALRRRDYSLPRECPYRLEDVTAFQHKRDAEPRRDVWPPQVAQVLNQRLFTNYPTQDQQWSR